MGVKTGLVGYAGCGKSTLFELLTGVQPDPSKTHEGQTAMATVPEPLVEPLCELYQPKKVTMAALELTDTPGLSRDQQGNAPKLSILREADCLVLVVPAFAGKQPADEIATFEEDLLLADLDIVARRVERLRESTKKPRPNREKELAELTALEPLLAHLETGKPLRDFQMSDEQVAATRSFRLMTEKPRLVIVNTPDDETDFAKYVSQSTERDPILAAPLGLELELSRMEADEAAAFAEEMGLQTSNSRDAIIRKILEVSGQMLFFTAGEKEVRTWLVRRGSTAQEAAGSIHTDLAKGFVRAEVFQVDDILRAGSERELKAQGLMRREMKDYVVKEGDVLHILAN